MKQHITLKQLNELSEKGKERLRKWWKPKEGDRVEEGWINWVDEEKDEIHFYNISFDKPWECDFDQAYPLLSIGQMIEFVRDNDKKHLWTWYFFDGPHAATKDICGILWEAVKEILER